jgi:hypothetical protein
MDDNKEKKEPLITPEVRAAFASEMKVIEDASFAKGREAGATAERERIQGIESIARPGHEKLIHQMKFDGKSTKADAAIAIVDAENAKIGGRLEAIKKDAPAAVAASDSTKADAVHEQKPGTGGKGEAVSEDVMAKLAIRANEYQAAERAKGREVSNTDAVKFAYQEAGVPLK